MHSTRWATLLAMLFLFGRVTSAQDLVRYEGDRSLETRWTWAMQSAPGVQTASGFWVGYSFTRMMCESCYSGTRFGSERKDLPTLNELLTGTRGVDDDGSLREAARHALDELDRGGRMVPKEIAVLFEFERDGRAASDLEMTNMTLPFDPGGRPILWLGSATDEESIALLRSVFESTAAADVRKGAVWVIGMHDLSDLTVPFLTDVLSSDETTEIRKSAAYSLGNQSTDRALQALRASVSGDTESEISKAAVYAIGNMDLEAAVEALSGFAVRPGLPMEVRKAAVYALGNVDSDEARQILIGLITKLD